MMQQDRQLGASLVTVLMIVAAMSAIGVGITQSITQGVSRAKVLDGQAQLRVSVAAAEAFAHYELMTLLIENEGRLTPDMPGFFTPISRVFEDGSIALRFVDRTNCFDLNRLGVDDGDGNITADPDERQRLIDVLVSAGIDRYAAEVFVESAADWIDSDTLTQLRGAENNYYESESSPVRSRGDWFVNETEMFGVRGFNENIREIAGDLLCVRPRNASKTPVSLLNINTINDSQLPLLVVAYQGEVELSVLEDALRRRPIAGWDDIEGFIADSAITEMDPEFIAKGAVSIYSQYIQTDIRLQYEDMVADYEVLFEISLDAPAKIVRRRRSG